MFDWIKSWFVKPKKCCRLKCKKECNKAENKPIAINVDPPGLVFLRKFRWTFTLESAEIFTPDFVKTVDFNLNLPNLNHNPFGIDSSHNNGEIVLSVYNVYRNGIDPVDDWIVKYNRDKTINATMTCYDGCGTPMVNYIFKNVRLYAVNPYSFDYHSSEGVTTVMHFSYEKVEITFGRDNDNCRKDDEMQKEYQAKLEEEAKNDEPK